MTQGKPVSTLAQQHMIEGQQRRRLAEQGKNIPRKEGFYWAQWRIADEGTPEGDEQTPSTTWEVVFVFENCSDTDDPEWLKVLVPGQSKSQSLENFFWGPGPLSPPNVGRSA